MTHPLKRPLGGLGVMLAGLMVLPMAPALAIDLQLLEANPAQLLARGGGGVKGGGGGRRSSGPSGFGGAGAGLNRGSARPTGGWSNRVGGGGAGSAPSLNRPAAASRPSSDRLATRDRSSSRDFGRNDRLSGGLNGGLNGGINGGRSPNRDGNRNGNRDLNRDINRNVNRDISRNVNRDINRNWSRDVNLNNVNLYPGWARPGWGVARPWNYGWYGGWATPAWGWWGARAAAWGITTLATAAIINDAVDDAVDDHSSYIVVPNTNYQLLYGTVQPSSSDSVSFVIQADGNDYQLTANCKQGTINGQEPSNASEAQLLNAACQVAYGSV